MSAVTSVLGGVLLCALLGAFTNQHYALLAFGAAALGAWLPHQLERVRLMQRFGHQTLSHSLVGLGGVAVLASPLLLVPHHGLFMAVLVGYTAHLLLDAVTPRGVALFHPSVARAVLPRQILTRIEPGSARERLLSRWLLGLCLVALPLNAVGVRGLLHQLIPVPQFAVEDYVTWSSHGRRVEVDVTGRFNASQQRIAGRWDVLDVPSATSLLVADAHGMRYTVGTHPQDTIRAFTVRAHRGPRVNVALQSVHLQEQPLSDLLPLIPAAGKTYLIGTARILEHVPTHYPLDQFRTIHVGANQLEFRYATAQDLRDQHLTDLVVTEGEFLLRTIEESGRETRRASTATAPPTPVVVSSRIVTITVRHLHDSQDLLVQPHQEVTHGQLLADLQHYRAELLTKQQAVEAQVTAADETLDQLRLQHEQELALKQQEDALAGTQRELTALQAKHEQEFARALARLGVAQARLNALQRQLAETTLRSPVSGRVVSIRTQQSTATIRILAHE